MEFKKDVLKEVCSYIISCIQTNDTLQSKCESKHSLKCVAKIGGLLDKKYDINEVHCILVLLKELGYITIEEGTVTKVHPIGLKFLFKTVYDIDFI